MSMSGFVTPTIIHFCAALLISAILSAPWPGHHLVQLSMGLVGLGGIHNAWDTVNAPHHATHTA